MTIRIWMVGQRYGRLVVLGYVRNWGRVMVRCRCDCGHLGQHDAADLRRGHTQSCGCLASDQRAAGARSIKGLRWAGRTDRLSEAEREALGRWVQAVGYRQITALTGLHLWCLRHAREGVRAAPRALAAIRALLARPAPEPRCQHPGCSALVVCGPRGRRCIYCPEHRVVRTGRPQTGKRRKRRPAPAPAPPPRPVPLAPLCPQCHAEDALRRQGREVYCVQRCGYYLTPGAARRAA